MPRCLMPRLPSNVCQFRRLESHPSILCLNRYDQTYAYHQCPEAREQTMDQTTTRMVLTHSFSLLLLWHRSAMVQGKAFSEDARRIIYRLYQSQLITVHDMAHVMGVHRATIHRVVAQYERTGHFQGEGTRTGRPRALDYAETQVRSNWNEKDSL